MRRETADKTMRNVQEARIAAPRELVWRQLGLTDGYFATLPVNDVTIDADGRRATFAARLGFGRLAISRRGSATVTAAQPRDRLGLAAGLDDGSMEMQATIELADGDEHETLLTYDVELRMPYDMPRMRRLLSGMLDEHVTELVRDVSETAARHWRAEVAMGRGGG